MVWNLYLRQVLILVLLGVYSMKSFSSTELERFSERHILAFDVETSGSSHSKNGLLSIGASLQNMNSEEKLAFQVNLLLPEGREFEADCLVNFWDKHPEVREFVQKDALPPEEAIGCFSAFLDEVEVKYPDLVLVSDNPSFDIAWLDHYLSLYASRKPIRYTKDGIYRMIWDSASVQKTWLCLKESISSFIAPRGHREKLGFNNPYSHDHMPLNDARAIAYFYNETIKQMQQFISEKSQQKGESVTKLARIIEIVKYDHHWPKIFLQEAELIKKALGNICTEVLHVGSTAVPGLIAKPIVDIIAVVNYSPSLDSALACAGYRYKGEYNLPLRRMYGKKGSSEIYLHVHEHGSPEVDLNVMFRDYLIAHPEAQREYAFLKRTILEADASHSKVESSGVTTYNLKKNDFIQSIIRATGFKGFCPRLCTQHSEWQAYNAIKKEILENEEETTVSNDPNQKHLVLYKGADIVAAARFRLALPHAIIEFSGPKENEEARTNLLEFIEKWTKRQGVRFLTISPHLNDASFYGLKGYKRLGSKEDIEDLFKYLP